MKSILAIAALSAVIFSGYSKADVIHGDLNSLGDNSVILDLNTGLEWVTLENTRGLSISQALSLDEFSGYRVATASEYEDLYFSVTGVRYEGTVSLSPIANFRDYDKLIATIGKSGHAYSYGYVESGVEGEYYLSGVYSSGIRLSINKYTISSTGTNFGVYLVSQGGSSYSSLNDQEYRTLQSESSFDVPVSSSFFALSLAFAGVSLKRRKV